MSSIKSIGELERKNFFIPSYQRGYRWTEQQVEDLLNDIQEFVDKEKQSENDWYCIQPLVVKKNNDKYEVIDGQQRLTTIFLILKFLQPNENEIYHLEYETRKNSAKFLKNINEEEKDKNIDYFHIDNAYETIKEWFDNKDVNKETFKNGLLNSVKFIWYEVAEGVDSITVFTRLNMGKIPLTNSELIKALFLINTNFDKNISVQKQLEIASQWDSIEYALQNDEFWYFLNKEGSNSTRIDFIFNFIYENNLLDISKEDTGNDEYATFRYFYNNFQKEKVNEYWGKIKSIFQTFEDWFEDRELYHKIGYLVTVNTQNQFIKDIYDLWKGKSKIEFRGALNEKIKESIKGVDLNSLGYGDDNVRKVLLLHNVLTMNKRGDNTRFSWHKYKTKKWDIEHIHALATNVELKEDKIQWLEDNFIQTELHNNTKLNTEIEEIKQGKRKLDEDFSEIIRYVLGEEEINGIENLCLLGAETNRAYKNDGFYLKRKTIAKQELKGTFIPICTRNVFSKYYTENPKGISLWNKEDRDAYLKNIKQILKDFLPQTKQEQQ